jgi:putative membrane protein
MFMGESYPAALLKTDQKTARLLIWVVSGIVFGVVAALSRIQVPAPTGLDVHIFAKANAVINSLVSLLLIAGLVTAKSGRWQLHRRVMLAAMCLSAIFLVSYILHHLFAGDTKFGGQGWIRPVYYFILITHIFLAAGSLPFILFTAYRALAGKYAEHARMARRVWPIWFYVSLSGVIVYFLISPYYVR